jgi:lipocalin
VGFRFCIVGLDPAYRYAVAGNPGGQFLWLMSRSASAPAEVFRKLIAIAAANGFDVSPCLLSLEALPAAQPVYGDRI